MLNCDFSYLSALYDHKWFKTIPYHRGTLNDRYLTYHQIDSRRVLSWITTKYLVNCVFKKCLNTPRKSISYDKKCHGKIHDFNYRIIFFLPFSLLPLLLQALYLQKKRYLPFWSNKHFSDPKGSSKTSNQPLHGHAIKSWILKQGGRANSGPMLWHKDVA